MQLNNDSKIKFPNKKVSRTCPFISFFQMEDGHSLFDYDVGLNDLIQIMVRKIVPVSEPDEGKTDSGKIDCSSSKVDDSGDKENVKVMN